MRLSTQQAALKILSLQLDDADVQAFEREAETIAALIHPNIVRILDFDIMDGTPFLVMDYAPNGSLRRQHQPGQQVPLSVVVAYIQQVAEGLQYAHDHKIIHHDIKPNNILIGVRNEIVLSDDQSVQIWDVTSGACAFVYRAHKSSLNSLVWSPDGQYIASASDDGIVCVWERPQEIKSR